MSLLVFSFQFSGKTREVPSGAVISDQWEESGTGGFRPHPPAVSSHKPCLIVERSLLRGWRWQLDGTGVPHLLVILNRSR